MELPLVVGVDGSERSLRAVDWAVDEAARFALPLRLVYASLWERYEGVDLGGSPGRAPERGTSEHIVKAAAERAHARDPSVGVATDVLPEDPERALLREAHNAAALVMGHASLAGKYNRVVLGIGDIEHGTTPIRFAFREAQTRRSVLDAVRTWRCPAHEDTDPPLPAGTLARHHEDQAARLLDEAMREPEREYADVEVRRILVEGPAKEALLHRAAHADLLVIGAWRRGHIGLQLGQVNHALLHTADCPVAVVPQWR
ncbi:universal stress protein [Streptomyces sp. PSKA30]|uniref:universal stress protein n=1 Tax=Streptomyces sp. PSKA30 TaxID=2874597 RepID=UPI001CD0EF79|nr:universal stress protein [Streptomyces sp. PSKA30]MBZ9644858.1 universal stress protein [Streptomyces sp. PSKA30]